MYETVLVPPLSSFAHQNPYAILDSGTTGTFLTPSDEIHLHNATKIIDEPTVLLASGTTMLSTLQGTLNLSEQLTPSAQSAFVLENQKNRQSHLSGIVM